MNTKLLKATLIEYAPHDRLADSKAILNTETDDINCTNCKHYSEAICCNFYGDKFAEHVMSNDICLSWEECNEES